MSEHERKADELEREVADMEEQGERVGDRIDETREAWHRKQADDRVPGAAGDPPGADEDERESDEEPPPEAQEPPGEEDD